MEGFLTEPVGAVSFLVPLAMSFLYKACLFSAALFPIYVSIPSLPTLKALDNQLNHLQLCGLFTYRLFLHPLRKYPGPILGSMTRWYAAFFVSRGVYHRQVLALHHAYGKPET